jgi:hypothetical protein
MSGWQPTGYDPRQNQQGPATPAQWQQAPYPAQQYDQRAAVEPWAQPAPQAQAAVYAARPSGLTSAGAFWYIIQCLAMGAGYFAKVPAKKALQDFGMARMTAAEQFWYVLMCLSFGAGYFAKLPVSKALSEMQQYR